MAYTASTAGWPLGWWGMPVKPLTIGATRLGTAEDVMFAGGELRPVGAKAPQL